MLSRLPSWSAPDALLIEALSSLREVAPVSAGSSLRAQVGERLPDGRWQIQAGDRSFALRLPLGVREGDVLDISRDGVRVITQREEGAAVAGGNRAAGAALANAATVSQSVVSPTGRLIAELTGGGSSGTHPATLTGTAEPLVAAAADTLHPDFEQLAAALKNTVTTSGLFYESHLAEWMAGERPHSELAQEPQARLPAGIAGLMETPGLTLAESVDPRVSAQGAPAHTGEAGRPPQDAALNIMDADSGDDAPSQQSLLVTHSAIDLPPTARDLVREQINLLESRQLAWFGAVWPGQNMEWEIGESPQRELQPEIAPAWYTRLKLTLPNLGQLDARLAWQPGGLRLRLAADDAGQQVLKGALPALQSALSAAGIQTGLATVEDHEHP